MFLHITEAKYVKDYTIKVLFSNGKEGEADLSEALKGSVFTPLKKISAFSDFTIDKELETIVWSNGADLAPEYVYFQAFKHEPQLQPLFKQWGYIA